jgi:carboxylate-amine ligase
VSDLASLPVHDPLAGYPAVEGYDEAVALDGAARPEAEAALATLAGVSLRARRALVHEAVRARGAVYRTAAGAEPFEVDPVPRSLSAQEWDTLARGLEQRLLALDAFVRDVYGAQRILAEGVVPPRVVGGAEYYEPLLTHLRPPGGRWIGIAGFDVVRDADGTLAVLEDNLRTPSGIAYAVAAREAVTARLDPEETPAPRGLDATVPILGAALRAATPPAAPDAADPHIVLLTDGPANSAHWEHVWLARALGIALVEPGDLCRRGDRLLLRATMRPVDVVYRRTNADRAGSDVGRLLLPLVAAGTLGVVNFGTGVADDKLVHGYVEDMVRFYLGEEPAVPSVQTFDLARPECLSEALDRFGELVVKRRAGHGGIGVVVCAHARRADVETARRAVIADPSMWVAQPMVSLSTHPTVIDGRLCPRHVDLRPFAVQTADGATVLPAALTRVAFGSGALVVNSSQNGGAKDTWVVP